MGMHAQGESMRERRTHEEPATCRAEPDSRAATRISATAAIPRAQQSQPTTKFESGRKFVLTGCAGLLAGDLIPGAALQQR